MTIAELQKAVHALAVEKGWYDNTRTEPELLCLIHSEVSECLEGIRHGNPPSDKVPMISQAEEELADVIIRVLDMAAHYGWDMEQAVCIKHGYNTTRAYRHGGKKY